MQREEEQFIIILTTFLWGVSCSFVYFEQNVFQSSIWEEGGGGGMQKGKCNCHN